MILDMHDYGFDANGELIGQTPTSARSFASSWSTIASAFRDRRNVIFGLMNEPHFQSPALWRVASNLAIAAIRAAGAQQGILVPTTDWSIASRWNRNGNPEEMLKIADPVNNFAFELHQYFDSDQSGTRETVRDGIGATSLLEFTNWRARKQSSCLPRRICLGEQRGRRTRGRGPAHLHDGKLGRVDRMGLLGRRLAVGQLYVRAAGRQRRGTPADASPAQIHGSAHPDRGRALITCLGWLAKTLLRDARDDHLLGLVE